MLDLSPSQSSGREVVGLFIFNCLFWIQICFAEDGGWRSLKGRGQTWRSRFPKWRPVPCYEAWFPTRRTVSWSHCPLGYTWKEISGIPAADAQEPRRTSEEPAEPAPLVPKGQNLKFHFIFIWPIRTLAIWGAHCGAVIHLPANGHDWVFSKLCFSAICLLCLARLCGSPISSYLETHATVSMGTLLVFATIPWYSALRTLEGVWVAAQGSLMSPEKACLSSFMSCHGLWAIWKSLLQLF